jgi:hypothetical protein
VNLPGGVILLVFGLIWSGVTCSFDAMIANSFWQRLRAESFPTVSGKIIKSQIRTSRGSKGSTNYRPDLVYQYRVSDIKYTGTQYQFGDLDNSGSRWASRLVGAFPVGKEVLIHYDPSNPASAALATGLDGSEIFMTLFLTPFNCAMLAIWSVPMIWLRGKFRSPVAGGVKLETVGNRIRAKVYVVGPIPAGLIAVGISAFVSIFAVGFATDMHPTPTVAMGTWLVVLSIGGYVFIRRSRRIRSGVEDLLLDLDAGTVTLPCHKERKDVVQVPLAEIQGVRIEKVIHRSSKGGTSYSYAPTFCLTNGREERIADWYDESKAKGFTQWLEEQILTGRDAPPKRSKA